MRGKGVQEFASMEPHSNKAFTAELMMTSNKKISYKSKKNAGIYGSGKKKYTYKYGFQYS